MDEYVYDALAAGASGFVLKDDPPERLITHILAKLQLRHRVRPSSWRTNTV